MNTIAKTLDLDRPEDLCAFWQVLGVVPLVAFKWLNLVSGMSAPQGLDGRERVGRLSPKTIQSALGPLRNRRQRGQAPEKGELSQRGHLATGNRLVDALIGIPLFDGVDGSELETIVPFMNFIDVQPGEYVFKEGDRGSYMCFAAEGLFDVLKKPVKGKSLPISLLRKGQSMGEMSVIDNYPRSATVRARTKGTLVTLSRDNFEAILTQYPSIGIKLFRKLSRMMSLHLRKTSSGFADQLFLLNEIPRIHGDDSA